MGFIALLLFLSVCVHQDFVKCEKHKLMDVVLVELGDSLILNCTYNCSSGFVHGYWLKEDKESVPENRENNQEMCTVFLQLQNVSRKDLKKYHCYSEIHDSNPIVKKTELVVQLQLRDPLCCKSHTSTRTIETTNLSLPAEPKDTTGKPGMNDGMKVLAAVTITVALVLAALAVYLCLTRSRQGCNGKDQQPPVNMPKSSKASGKTVPLSKGPTPKQSERVTLRLPTPETEGDPEVPYADIVISVRGASTPDLSQALYLNSADRNEWWTAKPGPHLQAARSADMLHVPHPREVSRKMSTNSEYAVIMYA